MGQRDMGRASTASDTTDFTEAEVEKRARRLILVYTAHNKSPCHGNF